MPALIALAYASLLVLGLLDNIRGPYFPEVLSDLHLNGTRGSLFFATTSMMAFVGSWTSHHLVRRLTSLGLMRIASLLVAIGFFLMSRVENFCWMLPCCALFGYGYGAINLAQNLMVFESSPGHLRGRYFSGLHAMYGFAALLAPLVAFVFREFGWSWRDTFFVLSSLAVLLLMVSLPLASPRTREAKPSRPLDRGQWGRCLLFSLMMAGYLWGEVGVSTRLVLWLRTDRQFTPDWADGYLGGFFVLLLAGRIVFGLVHSQRLSNWSIMKWSAACSAVVLFLGLHGSPLWIVLGGLLMSPFFPLAMEQVSVLFAEQSAQALGFVLGFGSFSVVLMHLTMGALSDAWGVSRSLEVAPVTMALIAAGLWLRQRRVSLQSQ